MTRAVLGASAHFLLDGPSALDELVAYLGPPRPGLDPEGPVALAGQHKHRSRKAIHLRDDTC